MKFPTPFKCDNLLFIMRFDFRFARRPLVVEDPLTEGR